MTVKELAIQYGTTTRTIYRRLIKHGLNIDELRDTDGKLSDEAVERIGELFANDVASAVANCVAKPVTERDAIRRIVAVSHNEETEELRKKLADAESRATAAEAEVRRLSDRVDDLTRQLSEVRATLDDVRSDRDEWKRQAASLTDAVKTAQEAREREQQLYGFALQRLSLQQANPQQANPQQANPQQAERVGIVERVRRMFKGTKKAEE